MKLVFKAYLFTFCKIRYTNQLFEANRHSDNILIQISIPDPDYKNVLP